MLDVPLRMGPTLYTTMNKPGRINVSNIGKSVAIPDAISQLTERRPNCGPYLRGGYTLYSYGDHRLFRKVKLAIRAK